MNGVRQPFLLTWIHTGWSQTWWPTLIAFLDTHRLESDMVVQAHVEESDEE